MTAPPYRAHIEAAWIDYNGHLRDAYYGLIVSHAIDDFMDHLGLTAAYRRQTRCTLYTLEMHFHYLHEVKHTDEIEVTTRVLDFDTKRIHVGCSVNCPRLTDAAATADVMLLHVQQGGAPRSAALPGEIERTLQTLKSSTDGAPAWGPASRKIEIKRREPA